MTVNRTTADYRFHLEPAQIKWVDKKAQTHGDRSKVMRGLIEDAMAREKRLGGATELEKFASFLEKFKPKGCEDVSAALKLFLVQLAKKDNQ